MKSLSSNASLPCTWNLRRRQEQPAPAALSYLLLTCRPIYRSLHDASLQYSFYLPEQSLSSLNRLFHRPADAGPDAGRDAVPADAALQSVGRPADAALRSAGRPVDAALQSADRLADAALRNADRLADAALRNAGRPADAALRSAGRPADAALRSAGRPAGGLGHTGAGPAGDCHAELCPELADARRFGRPAAGLCPEAAATASDPGAAATGRGWAFPVPLPWGILSSAVPTELRLFPQRRRFRLPLFSWEPPFLFRQEQAVLRQLLPFPAA